MSKWNKQTSKTLIASFKISESDEKKSVKSPSLSRLNIPRPHFMFLSGKRKPSSKGPNMVKNKTKLSLRHQKSKEDTCKFCKAPMHHTFDCSCGETSIDVCKKCHDITKHMQQCDDCGDLIHHGPLCKKCSRKRSSELDYFDDLSAYSPDPETCDCGRIAPGGSCGKCQDDASSEELFL